jgi:outer membrane protein OmpA-like peptidoglycan-associated protein
LGLTWGTIFENTADLRLYLDAAFQLATNYDQDPRNFSETDPNFPRPRFEYFGTNPLFHEYGNTLFYSAGLAVPFAEDRSELFSEFKFFHSFEDKDYIPMFEDGKELDVVQDGGMANLGVKVGFGNGMALSAGWGGYLFGEEPLYENPTWKIFAGLTYNQPEDVLVEIAIPEVPAEAGRATLPNAAAPMQIQPPVVGPGATFDCRQELAMVHFEFDKSTLTPEGLATLQRIGKVMRLCNQMVLEVQGHTDWMGTENYNIGLGNRRARAVVYYLVYDEGVDPARIVSPDKLARGIIAGETYGESVPIATNETDAGRALNRRTQFVKLVPDNRVIGR